jgi:hypothetical protein
LTKEEHHEPNKWFVIQDTIAYRKRPNLIGNEVDKLSKKPMCRDFGKIRKGDILVYYAHDVGLVIDLFEVVSDIEYSELKPPWDAEVTFFRIRPLERLLKNSFLNIKKLVKESVGKDTFEAFPEDSLVLSSLDQKKMCLPFNGDFTKIEKALFEKSYIVERDKNTSWGVSIELLSGLLDYYNSRATSFVNLLLASFFGIITL